MKVVNYITPECCEKAKTSYSVRLGLYAENIEYGKWKKVKPKWYIIGSEVYYERHFPTKVEIESCPFCHTLLPDLDKNDKKLKITEGDEEYCKTCDNRNRVCNCYPPEFRWKIKDK